MKYENERSNKYSHTCHHDGQWKKKTWPWKGVSQHPLFSWSHRQFMYIIQMYIQYTCAMYTIDELLSFNYCSYSAAVHLRLLISPVLCLHYLYGIKKKKLFDYHWNLYAAEHFYLVYHHPRLEMLRISNINIFQSIFNVHFQGFPCDQSINMYRHDLTCYGN